MASAGVGGEDGGACGEAGQEGEDVVEGCAGMVAWGGY